VMVMLAEHTKITTRHKDKTILYWFGPPESKTLRPVLRFVLLRSQVGLHDRGVDGGGLQVVPGRMPLLALYWATDKVGGPESRSVTTVKSISSQLQYGRLIRADLIRLDCLVFYAKLSFYLRAHMSSWAGLLTGRRVFWWAGPTCRGRP
jgi:hypothetical protein